MSLPHRPAGPPSAPPHRPLSRRTPPRHASTPATAPHRGPLSLSDALLLALAALTLLGAAAVAGGLLAAPFGG